MKIDTVPQALEHLRVLLAREACDGIRRGIDAALSEKFSNGIAPQAIPVARKFQPKRKYRLSAAGRAKRIAAVKAYWRKRKAGK